ncbi:MAG: response regulator [gamma proteobacterium symbiont of Phacoides pectinatus]
MTIPVLICDDSSFARKQVARSLPENWDVELSYAGNGEEALELIRQGRADILFLDLTMPVLDGFGVLKTIREEDLPSLPIVISGDIQPESRRRVMSLGAVCFIKKPIHSDELTRVLNDYGLLQLSGERHIVYDEAVEFTDWCQEYSNISKGRAADLLARFIEQEVELSIPRVGYLERGRLAERLCSQDDPGGDDRIISQGFTGGGISGEMILTFNSRDAERIHNLLYHKPPDKDASELEAIMDMANILSGAYLRGMSEQIDELFSIGQPITRTRRELIRGCERIQTQAGEQILLIECDYTIANRISCNQWLLFPQTSADALEARAAPLME